eukprot:scaffold1930_cov112-Isochrysis_galbana.AAC.4
MGIPIWLAPEGGLLPYFAGPWQSSARLSSCAHTAKKSDKKLWRPSQITNPKLTSAVRRNRQLQIASPPIAAAPGDWLRGLCGGGAQGEAKGAARSSRYAGDSSACRQRGAAQARLLQRSLQAPGRQVGSEAPPHKPDQANVCALPRD